MKEFVKNNLKTIIYACVGVITVIMFTVLLVWASAGNASAEINIVEAVVRTEEDVRNEYLVGEQLDGTGISLKAGKKTITEVVLTGDTSSAGLKRVEVSGKDGNTNYRGYFNITVFAVRHCEMQNSPTDFYYDDNGVLKCDGLEIWAELNAKPTQFETVEGYETTILLPDTCYELNMEADEENEGAYNMKVEFGNITASYYCVSINDRIIMLNSPRRVLNLVNTDGTEETLQLYVTQIEASAYDGDSGAYGYYVFTDAEGNKTFLQFKYYLDGSWVSHFGSESFDEGMVDAYDSADEGYNAVYNGVNFHADKLSWHKAVLDWDY